MPCNRKPNVPSERLSAEVTEALARELRRRRLQALVAEYEQEKGTISAKELAAIQAEWLA